MFRLLPLLALLVPRIAMAATTVVIPNPLGSENFLDLFKNVTAAILNLAIPIAAVMYIYAGFLLITGRGESGKITKAKEVFKYTTLGLVVIFIGGGFVSLIRSILDLGN